MAWRPPTTSSPLLCKTLDIINLLSLRQSRRGGLQRSGLQRRPNLPLFLLLNRQNLPFEVYLSTPEARSFHTILPGQHELSSSTWCLWLKVWLGAAVYGLTSDSSAPCCYPCGKPMELFGWLSLANFGTGYGRIPRHKNSTSQRATKPPSRGLLPRALRRMASCRTAKIAPATFTSHRRRAAEIRATGPLHSTSPCMGPSQTKES